MVVKTWDVKEQFLFPESFGIPKEIKTVEVTPQFEQNETEDSINIIGIYHITCHVEFEEGEHAHHATSEFTQIEDLDVQGEVGYFEYAVPMSIEISKEKVQTGCSPTLNVQHVNSKTTEHASIEIAWSVQCEYETAKESPVKASKEKVEVEKESTQEAIKEATKEANYAESTNMEQSELQFIFDLDDGMSKLTVPSNYVFVKQEAEE
ncbi:hypothetical protein [Psychrobacillus vulpis]|uniref:Uncharacterized protein n=1 Tax=Psychrobacillus vulpis TaxID=2325572 RepID=A0A544TP26_9BACI|nr:hypothetical protein [Psychrobacillus vulpis]TQR19185.1 hypothetical protein FG384_13305 [Psychrobacillus vulpis]